MNVTIKNELANILSRHHISAKELSEKTGIGLGVMYRMVSSRETTHHARSVKKVLNAIAAMTGIRYEIGVATKELNVSTATDKLWQTLPQDELLTEIEFQMWRIRCYLEKHNHSTPFISVIDTLIDVDTWHEVFPEYRWNPSLPMRFITQEEE